MLRWDLAVSQTLAALVIAIMHLYTNQHDRLLDQLQSETSVSLRSNDVGGRIVYFVSSMNEESKNLFACTHLYLLRLNPW